MAFLTISLNAFDYKIKINKKSYSSSIIIESAQKCMEDYNQNGDFCEKLLIDSFGLNCTMGDLNTENKDCTIILDEIRTVTCSGGYTDNGNGTCSGTQVTSAYYSCPSGYSNYSGSTCSLSTTRSPSESCPAGTRTFSGSCYYSSLVNYCPSGYTLISDFLLCEKRVNGVYVGSVSATCSSGLSQSGSYCYNASQPVNKQLSCTSGFTLSGSVCTGTFYASKSYSCSGGYSLSGSTCSRSVTEVSGIAGCTSGYVEVSSTLCQKTIIEEAIISCPETYSYNAVEDMCEKLEIVPIS